MEYCSLLSQSSRDSSLQIASSCPYPAYLWTSPPFQPSVDLYLLGLGNQIRKSHAF